VPRRPVICYVRLAYFTQEARVLRHLRFLGEHFDFICIGYGDDPSKLLPGVNIEWHSIHQAWGRGWLKIARTLARWPGCILPPLDWVPDWMMADWRAARRLIEGLEYDLFMGSDVSPLLLAVWQQRKKGKPFIMDYHEYAPLEAEEKRWHRWFHGPQSYRLLRRYGAMAAGSSVVNEQFAARMQQEFGVRAVCVMNAPELIDLPPKQNADDGRLHMVFHGHPGGDRNLDALLRAMPLLDDRFVLHLMLMSGMEPDSEWRRLAALSPAGRVVFEGTVTPRQTVARLVQWDIGFNILAPLNYNHRHALPNKFFDYIHAGLASVCSDTVTGRDFCERFGIGWVLNEVTPESLASLLMALTPEDIAAKKQAALKLREQIHARTEEAKLVAVVQHALQAA
jgi:glycosyltransferase involved in cell wall biosynthesis